MTQVGYTDIANGWTGNALSKTVGRIDYNADCADGQLLRLVEAQEQMSKMVSDA